MVKWNPDNNEKIIKSINSKFNIKQERSVRSVSRSEIESDPEKFIDRVRGQIMEVYDNNLPYMTPEDWDSSFYYLGGGSSRRRSSSILNRMSWNHFLNEYDRVVNEEIRNRG